MWTRKLLKENGKIAFKRNYWLCVAASAIALFLMGGGVGLTGNSAQTEFQFNEQSASEAITSMEGILSQIPPGIMLVLAMTILVGLVIGVCVAILVSNVVQVGVNRFFLENREHKTNVGQVFYGFQGGRYGSTVWIMFLKGLYIFGWTLLFWIPGIIKTYAYLLVPYIIAENPHMDKKRVFELSSEMMKGHKWEAFVLGLSFIGWSFLAAITGGILGIFYVNPYQHATFAEFYSAVKAEALQKGIVMPGELPGVEIPEVEIPVL